MPKDKLNLEQLNCIEESFIRDQINNLNQVGLNVINFDEHFQEQFFNKKENEKNEVKKDKSDK